MKSKQSLLDAITMPPKVHSILELIKEKGDNHE